MSTSSELVAKWLKLVSKQPSFLQSAPMNIRNNRDVVTRAVTLDATSAMHASIELLQDREIAKIALRRKTQNLEEVFAPFRPFFQADFEIMLYLVKADGIMLSAASDNLKDNLEIVTAAVNSDPWCLTEASKRLQDFMPLVMKAVTKNGMMLQAASPRLKQDHDVVFAAVRSHEASIGYADKSLLQDRGFVLRILRLNGMVLGHLPKEHRDDEEFLETALVSNGYSFVFASIRLKEMRHFQEMAVRYSGETLRLMPAVIRGDKRMVELAMQTAPKAFQFATLDMRDDVDLAIAAVAFHPLMKRVCSDRLSTGGFLQRCTLARIAQHETFKRLLVFADSFEPAAKKPTSARPVLQKINAHGPHFASFLKRLIADFSGTPSLGALGELLRAKQNFGVY